MNITKFSEKLNKLEGNVYTIEEEVTPISGVYEADLGHDNVEPNTINVYTGSKCTGNKVNSFVISTPSLTPWKIHIIIYSSEPKLYITYESMGDTVEANDINTVQEAINDSQKALNDEITRATNASNTLQTNINNEITRAKKAESDEVTRAKKAENTLQTNINNEVTRAKSEESKINTALNNVYTKTETFTKNEVTKKIQDVIGVAPAALDTLQEIAKSLNNDSDFAGTITKELSKKADKSHTHTKSQITDMPTKLSQFTNDAGFIKAADVDTSQNHIHSNKTVLDKITQNSLDNWNDCVRRIAFVGSDADGTNGWYKVAEQTCSGYGDANITFMVTSTYSNYNVGILQLQIRSDNSNISCRTLKWLTRIGFNVKHYIVVIDGMKWTLYANQPSSRYGRIAFEILSMSSIDNKNIGWALTFKDNNTKETTTPVATVTSSDGATVDYAARATKAANDVDGNRIDTTYVKKGMTWAELEGKQ